MTRKTSIARSARPQSDGHDARPEETPDTAESAALYAALERVYALPAAARTALLADTVEAAAAHLADLAALEADTDAGRAARAALARIDREIGELLAALATLDR